MSGFKILLREEGGAAAVETAFALPVFIVLLWAMIQGAYVYRGAAGIQQALGQGARYATLCVNPTTSGCGAPTKDQIKTAMDNAVFGDKLGTYTSAVSNQGTDGTGKYYDLTVTYSQPTNLLLLPGPTMSIKRSKRVWIAG